MPRIFDNIDQQLLPALRETLELSTDPPFALAILIFAAGSRSTLTLNLGRAGSITERYWNSVLTDMSKNRERINDPFG